MKTKLQKIKDDAAEKFAPKNLGMQYAFMEGIEYAMRNIARLQEAQNDGD
jgi:hypothetical protein